MRENDSNPDFQLRPDLIPWINAICASPGFRRSARLQRFLQYVVHHSVISPDKPLKEARIAVDVFERRRNFDPQIDPIVRVEAGRLRLRMTEYYAGPGQNDDIIIEIGKGGYFATFNPNTAKPTLQPGNDVAVAYAAAYRLYLKGRYFWDKRTLEGLKKASEYFERASALNPAFVQATIGVADCNLVAATFEFAAPTEAIANARKKVEEVLRCNVRSAGARTTLSAIQAFYDRDWSAAEAGFKRAIEIDAKYATAWQWYGVYGIALGRLDEGLNALRHATECDPLSLMANTQLACGLYLVRRYEEAKQLCDLALEIDPNCWPAHYFLGLTYQQQNLFAQAVRELRHAEELSNGNALAVAALAHVYGQAGSQLDARKILLQLHQGCSGYVSEWALALVYAGLGEREPALSALAQSIAAHSPQSAMFMSGEPRLDGLRSDPRFRQMQSVLYGQASLG